MPIELVVFDIAGTTVADNGNINQTFRDAFSKAGLSVAPEDVDKVMGYKKIEAIEIILQQYQKPLLPGNSANTIHDDFTKRMVHFYETTPTLQPLPYAEKIFEWLQGLGIKVALDTGFTRPITNAILHRLNWFNHPYISCVVCSDEVPEGRPAKYMIEAIMQQTGVQNTKHIAKVGDTEVDILEGRNADCGLVIAITTGACSEEQLNVLSPDYVIHSLEQLKAIIECH
ncbi:HAD hydrolase-like protein [Hydrotalea sandarakina]|jgi:phosphonatase-like hydrolase|uniref:Phosphonatase-like hydrolase n=1 Tax=Hydrotalea sandarakina TaxID=1004304 RepID=A0A2W7RR57_9BACT|nr:HAD hydrolase-like protein [Hydrotalea sandarakina]PZX62871.1 phosphonatase-like hydrolase [Hydrotalea sandarakina]